MGESEEGRKEEKREAEKDEGGAAEREGVVGDESSDEFLLDER